MRPLPLMLLVVLVHAAATACAQTSAPAEYPVRALRLVLPFPPGGGTDTLGRIVTQALSDALGQPVIAENRPGAGGNIGNEAVARAAPDGYTLWLPTMTQLIAALQAQKHMLVRDFAPVSLVASTPFVIVVGTQVPVKTLPEWIAYAKARPGKLSYGSSGMWGSSHLCMHTINELAGLDVVHVPYKGSVTILNDIVAGRIQAYCPAAPSLPAFTQGGRVKMLGVTYTKPTKLVPDVPPVAETLPGFELLGWYGLQAAAGTPAPIVEKIHAALAKVLHKPELAQKLLAVGAEPVGTSPKEFTAFLRSETERWEKVLRQGGVMLGVKAK